jgi:hypothetical protein
MAASMRRGEQRDVYGSVEEVWPLPVNEATLLACLRDCFEEWAHIYVGPVIEGAVWEIRPPRKPHFGTQDGYVTVDFEDWHFHLCIGPHQHAPEPLRRIRPTARAELYRALRDSAATLWGLRLFNGAGEQQITVLLPSPFLTDDQELLPAPDWSRLALWDRLRQKYLGLAPDPIDRAHQSSTSPCAPP